MSTIFSRALPTATVRIQPLWATRSRAFHTSRGVAYASTPFDNILAGDSAPPVVVKAVTEAGIVLADGMTVPGPCIFLEDKVFLWKVPEKLWDGWDTKHFEVFETVIPKPEILLFGTGKRAMMIPPALRRHLTETGIQVDVMDSRNACSTYNLLVEEGRKVGAALLPLTPRTWRSS